jgi:S1-C subfamily serine protease
VPARPGPPQEPLTVAAAPVDSGADSIVMGYPGGGGLYVGPARVRDRGEISGPDFRSTHTVRRDVYALFGQVRAGNSGGPLLSTDGTVLGVVFASAIDDPDTGYALTAAEVSDAVQRGRTAQAAVDTGPCE